MTVTGPFGVNVVARNPYPQRQIRVIPRRPRLLRNLGLERSNTVLNLIKSTLGSRRGRCSWATYFRYLRFLKVLQALWTTYMGQMIDKMDVTCGILTMSSTSVRTRSCPAKKVTVV